ncbi:MAG: hypothetical protein HXX18_07680 [Bacteroidetes bacterium]|nr:hypothetical protein [Bacteroidota bacterium]
MIDKFKNHFSIDNFFQDCSNFKVDKQTYDISYPEFLKYFSDIKTITKHNLVIGINFTYGWMPTIFDFRSENIDKSIDKAIEILNNAKNGITPNISEFETLKSLFNNSLVGTTKLLHFINPEIFAIWDSRVYYYLTGELAHHYRIGNCESYLSFLTFCKYLTEFDEYEELHNSICEKLGYTMTKFRTVEMIMYLNGGKAQKNKNISQNIF